MHTHLTPVSLSTARSTGIARHLVKAVSVAALTLIAQAASAQAVREAGDSFEALSAETQPWQVALPAQDIRFDTSDGLQSWIQTSPIPEPEAYAMWLVGIAAIGFVVRRRKIR